VDASFLQQHQARTATTVRSLHPAHLWLVWELIDIDLHACSFPTTLARSAEAGPDRIDRESDACGAVSAAAANY
jgi:hypothetical protein